VALAACARRVAATLTRLAELMKITPGKIRDFVEPQAYDGVLDFASDPASALAAYRFTDTTSDLLARWLDALADLPRGRGAALALAGLRGVGKSHTLAAFAALASNAALRQTVSDAHVATSARRLAGRRYTLVRTERGARATFGEELANALVASFGGHASEWIGDPAAVLARAVERARGSTLVLVVDTAYGRASRVSRDDGPALGAIATAARELDLFVALALDDDISGAEGANVALSQTFRIDYLEPEHLYQVANTYVLRKSAAARDRLHEIYLALRQTVPHFNWSEPRFAALYPVHPVVAEVAAAVRLHAHAFAFLPFAARAAQRALGRPTLSLVLLDEVFDHTERELRASKDLREAFSAYDELAAKAVAQFPALQRLQVRLVLKNLFVLSLDGRGATARDLAAALLLQDDPASQPNAHADDGRSAVERVGEILRRLADAAPADALALLTDDDGETCYRFGVGAHGGFDAALSKAIKQPLSDPRAITRLLDALARARFDDYRLAAEAAASATQGDARNVSAPPAPDLPPLNFGVSWRGSVRVGRVANAGHDDAPPPASQDAGRDDPINSPSAADDRREWELFILEPGGDGEGFAQSLLASRASRPRSAAPDARAPDTLTEPQPITLVWQPAELSAEEYVLLRRLHALRNDAALASFGEAARVAAGALAARAERVWSRLYVDDGALVVAGVGRFRFTDAARSSATLAGVLAEALAPLFGARHPQHPRFDAVLCEQDAARLVEEFFSGANTSETSVQQLAERFAVPLGLAAPRGNAYAHASCDEILRAPWAASVSELIDSRGERGASASEVRRALSAAPYGLARDAQHLVLAALVACGRAELLTMTGGLISRRTLGRATDWGEIAGVRRASGVHLGAAELTDWARRLTGRQDLPQINDAEGLARVRAALSEWLAAWRESTLLADFDEMPDSGLTTRSAKLASHVRRTLGAAADALDSALSTDAPLEDALQRVADVFASSHEEHARASRQLELLRAYVSGVALREGVRDYLLLAEPTGVEQIESARRELLAICEDPHTLFDEYARERFDLLCEAFRVHYAAHYSEAHERCVGPGADDRDALELVTRSAFWREFEALSALPFVDARLWREASRLAARARDSRCALPVAERLAAHPRCACGFRLSDADDHLDAVARLVELTERGRALYRRALSHFHAHLAAALEPVSPEEARAEVVARARTLANSFARGENPPQLNAADVSLILRALSRSPAPPPLVRVAPPATAGLLARDELAARVRQWLEELPAAPALVEIATESHTNAAAQQGI
jgi:truncated hemoglobin YjbI